MFHGLIAVHLLRSGYQVDLHIVHIDFQYIFPVGSNCSYDYLAVSILVLNWAHCYWLSSNHSSLSLSPDPLLRQVLDGAFLDSPEYGRYCSRSAPRAIFSSSRYLTLHLVSGYRFISSFRYVEVHLRRMFTLIRRTGAVIC